jgi:hypothetical protein
MQVVVLAHLITVAVRLLVRLVVEILHPQMAPD